MGTNEVDPRLVALVRSVLPDPALEIDADTDLYEVGLDSAGILILVTLLEDEFDLELDDESITRAGFASIGAIAGLLPR